MTVSMFVYKEVRVVGKIFRPASYHFDFNSRRKQLQAATEDKARKSPDSISNKTTVESVGRAGLTYTSPETIQSKLKVSFQNFCWVVKLE